VAYSVSSIWLPWTVTLHKSPDPYLQYQSIVRWVHILDSAALSGDWKCSILFLCYLTYLCSFLLLVPSLFLWFFHSILNSWNMCFPGQVQIDTTTIALKPSKYELPYSGITILLLSSHTPSLNTGNIQDGICFTWESYLTLFCQTVAILCNGSHKLYFHI
jgi:hypothetical protein